MRACSFCFSACSSSTLPSSSLAAILSDMLFLSSSLTCLNNSACLSYFSIKPCILASASTALFFNCVLTFACSIAVSTLILLTLSETAAPNSAISPTASPKLVITSLPDFTASAATSARSFFVCFILTFKLSITS